MKTKIFALFVVAMFLLSVVSFVSVYAKQENYMKKENNDIRERLRLQLQTTQQIREKIRECQRANLNDTQQQK